jgi:ribonuclease T1
MRLRAMFAIVFAVLLWTTAGAGLARTSMAAPAVSGEIAVSSLPQEARDTLALIRRGGPFRHPQDGTVFGNREKRLPARDRGYYREYTVPTPGARDRGARRIIAGGDGHGSGEYYYSSDHYNSFRRIKE